MKRKGGIMNQELSNQDPFRSFINLIKFDQDSVTLKREIQAFQDIVDELVRTENQLTVKKDLAYKQWYTLKKEVDSYELEMKQLDEQEKQKRRQLDTLSNVKEYKPLVAEIESIKKEQHALESDLIRAWNNLEAAQRQNQEQEQLYEKESGEIAIALKEKKEKIEQLKAAQELRESERSSMLEGIPHEWLERYEVMKGQISDPVVPVDQGYCGACYNTVSAQDLQQLRKRVLLQCKNCFRFLYDPAQRSDADDLEIQ